MAYDRYAAALYGYCHWMLHDSADAAESLQDTFVLAATTLSDLPEPSKLRPWLFALARNECRRRIRPRSVTRDEADAANQRADGGQRADEVGRPADATVQFRAVSEPIHEPADATVQFRVVSEPIHELADATVQFRVVSEPIHEPADATVQFRAVSRSSWPMRLCRSAWSASWPMRRCNSAWSASRPTQPTAWPMSTVT